MPATPMMTGLAALLTWLVPGSGYFLLRQRARGLSIGLTIVLLFLLGVLIGGVRVVQAPDLAQPNLGLLGRLLQQPWFIAQFFAGPLALVSAWWSANLPAAFTSHGRIFDIGTLYTAVAGMLNLMAVLDVGYRVWSGEEAK